MSVEFDSSKIEPHIIRIMLCLVQAGYETYLVGGAIRDILMQRVPKDYDISTQATPEEIRDVFGRRNARIIGKRFKLVHYYHGAEIIEISTFRSAPKESAENSLPDENTYGTACEDAWRRDFTVNAIFFDASSGRLVDFTGMGIADMRDRMIRVVGDPLVRLEEDPVRILRALKLVGQYGFTPEESTAEAMRNSLPLITQCSHSRLSLELEKIIRRPYSHSIFRAFHDFGFMPYYMPFLSEQWGSEQCRYMLDLLEERNKRILQGAYRDSVSLAIATASLPFVEIALGDGGPEGRGWQYRRGVEKSILQMIVKIFAPFHFPRRIVASAMGIILMQPSMLNMTRLKQNLRNKRYAHARELMVLQNRVKWQDMQLEPFWPERGICREDAAPHDGRAEFKSRPRRRKNAGQGKKTY